MSRSRAATIRDMSTSIALETWAEVSSERRMCSITPRRIAVIGSSTSPTWSGAGAAGFAGAGRAAEGAAIAGSALGSTGVATAAGVDASAMCGSGRAAVWAPDSMYARMSFFVTRPPVPVPATTFGSTPCSAAMRATTGETNVRPFPDPVADGTGSEGIVRASGVGAGSTAPGAGSGAPTASTAPGAGSGTPAASTTAEPAGAITASTVPISTVSPSATRISATTPSPGLGTSVSTLSVEISSSGSSWAIASPGCLSHFVIVPSETETPIWGITTSICVPVATARVLSGRL